jgi:hypothetical protein
VKLEWVPITSCDAVHENGEQCDRAAPHTGEHWYLAWADGEPDGPVFWGNPVMTCELCGEPAGQKNGRGETVCEDCAFSRWLECDLHALDGDS